MQIANLKSCGNGMMGAKPLDTGYQEFVEVDPKGRYGRYNDVLGKGASKTVYRAFDEYEGIEVAWNQVKLYDFLQSSDDLERLYCEIHLLKTLEHKNIMKFCTSWVDPFKGNINFITEMFTSGTLRQYREKHRRVSIRAMKHWCRQILTGLLYLHSHDPPIIHRDLKCDNIFINGHQGEVKIGDLGLAAILRKSHAIHCVGTPEFMAPEVYVEEYNELADIYSFGMCVLEMVTLDYPYSECTHPVQIYKKVISGTKPEALYRVKDPEVRQFIEKCLATASSRLSAKELLQDPFLQVDNPVSSYIESINNIDHHLQQPSLRLTQISGSLIPCMFSNDLHDEVELVSERGFDTSDIETHGMNLFHNHEDEHPPKMGITTKGRMEDGSISLKLRIIDKYGIKRNINFQFDTETDTALCVATEMVAELNITDYDVTRIADMIDEEVASLVPGWKPGPGIDEMSTDPSTSFCRNSASNVTSSGSRLEFSHHEYAEMYHQFGDISYQVEESKHCVADGSLILSTSLLDELDISSQASASKDSDGEGAQLDQLEKNKNLTQMNSNIRRNLRICSKQLSVVSHEQYFELPEGRNQNHTADVSSDYENVISPELGRLNASNQLDQQEYHHQHTVRSRAAVHPSRNYDINEFAGEDEVSSCLVSKVLQTPRGKIKSFHLGTHNSYHLPQNDTDSHLNNSIYLADGETSYRCDSHPNFQSPWGCKCEVNAGGG